MKLVGEINFANVVKITRDGERAIEANTSTEFDFTEVKHANSAVLALLLAWQRTANRLGKTIRFSNLSRGIVALAELCRVDTVLKLN